MPGETVNASVTFQLNLPNIAALVFLRTMSFAAVRPLRTAGLQARVVGVAQPGAPTATLPGFSVQRLAAVPLLSKPLV